MLLEKNANVTIQNSFGETPITTACLRGIPKVVELLLDYDSNQVDTQDCDGETPLFKACVELNVDIVDDLIQNDRDFLL